MCTQHTQFSYMTLKIMISDSRIVTSNKISWSNANSNTTATAQYNLHN